MSNIDKELDNAFIQEGFIKVKNSYCHKKLQDFCNREVAPLDLADFD